MTVSVPLPALGESVTEATVTRWLKQVGERVEADEPLLEVSTDKVDTEIPSPSGGVLLKILVAEDETAEVGAALGVIGAPETAPAASPPAGGAQAGPASVPAGSAPSAPGTPVVAPVPS
ncbi:MAG TPA: biotin/lipoyl-containing protein, partial [Streptomyces sp.]